MDSEAIRRADIIGDFMSSEIGRYVLERALAEHTRVIHQLLEVDTTDISAVTALKVRASVVQECINWLQEAIVQANVELANESTDFTD